MAHLLRTTGAIALVVGLSPLTAGPAAATSEDGPGIEFNKITICHRTNSEKNPYVEITIAKAAVFKQGHSGHDEGGVHQPGDKAAGIRWGDIIPTFQYYAGRQNTNQQTYPGLNNGLDGQAFLANGCNSPTPPPPNQPPEPAGTLAGECVDDDGVSDFVVSGALDYDGASDVTFRLLLSPGDPIPLSGSPYQRSIPTVGTVVQLQYRIGAEGTWTNTDDPVTVTACPPGEQPPLTPQGSFTVACDANGAVVTIGALSAERGVTWRLFVNGAADFVGSNDVVHVPGSATLDLKWRFEGNDTSKQTATAPPACPPAQPSGSFTTECIATGAQADVGALSQRDFSSGTGRLMDGTTAVATVTSGQQNVTVPVSKTITLQYVPAQGDTRTLDTKQSPAACPPPPPTGDVSKTSVPATGTVVAPGSTIAYTVTVKNTGQVAITNSPVVDTLPSFVTAVDGTVSDGGVVSGDGRTITWSVTLAPSATKTLTYSGLVATSAPAGTSLLNKVTFLLKESTTTHEVGSRDLTVEKAVSPTGAVRFGATLTYTLTVRATGNLPQSGVVVTDQVPAGTTYAADSASCDAAGTCTPTFVNGILRWELGAMSAGTVRTVTFRVTVDRPEAGADGAIPVVADIRNSGAVASAEVPTRPSNEVVTPVVAVGGTKSGPDDDGDTSDGGPEVQSGSPGTEVLAATGPGLPLPVSLFLIVMFLLGGTALVRVGRPVPRRTTG